MQYPRHIRVIEASTSFWYASAGYELVELARCGDGAWRREACRHDQVSILKCAIRNSVVVQCSACGLSTEVSELELRQMKRGTLKQEVRARLSRPRV